jgi:hypothetical protein
MSEESSLSTSNRYRESGNIHGSDARRVRASDLDPGRAAGKRPVAYESLLFLRGFMDAQSSCDRRGRQP